MRRSFLALVVLATLLAVGAPGGVASAASTTTAHGLSTVRGMILDPASGQIFVSGDDAVVVFNPDGTLKTTIPGLWGASGVDIANGSLWVAESTAGKVAKIDLTTLAVTQTYTLGAAVGDSLAVVGNAIFFGVPPTCCGWATAARFDTTTSATVTLGSYYGAAVKRIPGSTTHVLVYERGISSGQVTKISTTAPYAVAGTLSTNGYLGNIAVSTDGTKFWSATGSPYYFPEWNLTTMTSTGVIYPGTPYPRNIAYSPAFGGIIAGAAGGELWISKVGNPVTANRLSSGGDPEQLAIATDGSAVFYISGGGLTRQTLAPTLTGATPGTVVAGVPGEITVTGTGLGATTGATIGGTNAPVSAITTTSVKVSVPASLTAGAKTLVVASPFGNVSTSITVQANTGATLSGTVKLGATARSGVVLTLSGGGLTTARTTTSGATGQYSFTGVPYGTTYSLLAHDPAAGAPDQTTSNITLVPNLTSTLNIDLQAPSVPAGWKVATSALPAGQVRDALVEPVTGRLFVSNGDEVDVLDRNGALLSRIQGIWGANALTVGGGSVYVGSASASRVTRINPSTMASTASWPLNAPTNGSIAYAGGRIFFTNGNDQWTSIAQLDLSTGAVSSAGSGSLYVPRMRSIEGDPNGLLAWEVGISSNADYIYDASGATLTPRVSSWDIGSPSVASATAGRLWTAAGREFDLATLATTGVQYPGSGAIAHSPGRGGVLAFGSTIARVGTPQATHTMDVVPNQTALEPSGDRAFAVTSTNQVVVYDLKPYVTAGPGSPIYAEPSTLTFSGSGLGAATAVSVDGTSRSFTATPNQVSVTLPSLSVGSHSLTVTTPWGTSTAFAFSSVARPPAPTVSSVSPATVPTSGGTVTITGTNFGPATAVKVGTTAASSFTVVNATTITAVVPAHLPGSGTVTVTSPGGTNASGPTLTWVAPVPVVTSLSPAQGPPGGGTTVMITGTGFNYATGVTFGGTAATFTVVNATTITATAPAHATGAAPVLVTTAGGTSATTVASTYTYAVPPPTVTSLSPNFGSTSGGYAVLVKGTKFTGTTAVRFGATASGSFQVVDDTTLVAVAPAHSAGIVSVTVSGPAGTSLDVVASWFDYRAPPTASLIGSVRSSAGPIAGMTVLITPSTSPTIVASAVTGPDGTYAVPNLPIGDYKALAVDPAVFAGSPSYFIPRWYGGAQGFFDQMATATTFTVVAGTGASLGPIVLTHSQPGILSGTVTNGSAPLANMVVIVSPVSASSVSAYAVTGADGRFTVSGLAPGSYKVQTVDGAAVFGAPPSYVGEWYDNAGSFAAATIVTVTPSAAVTLNRIDLVHV